MYPASMQAPLAHQWYEVYVYVGPVVLPKHGKLPVEQSFWEMMGIQHPISYEQVKYNYKSLARDIRKRVVKEAAARGSVNGNVTLN